MIEFKIWIKVLNELDWIVVLIIKKKIDGSNEKNLKCHIYVTTAVIRFLRKYPKNYYILQKKRIGNQFNLLWYTFGWAKILKIYVLK